MAPTTEVTVLVIIGIGLMNVVTWVAFAAVLYMDMKDQFNALQQQIDGFSQMSDQWWAERSARWELTDRLNRERWELTDRLNRERWELTDRLNREHSR